MSRTPAEAAYAELLARPGVLDRLQSIAVRNSPNSKAADADAELLRNVWTRNPWTRAFENLTHRMRITRLNPELAAKLEAEAKRLDAAL